MMRTKEIKMAVVLIVALAVVLVSISGALADDTGWKDPSANAADTGGGGDGFEVNPTGAYTNDTNFASNMNGAYDCHSYYNYSFGIPTGTTIDGIEVRLDWWLDNTGGTNRMFATLSWNGGFDLTSPKMADTEGIGDGNPTDIVGGPTDTWGRSWSLDEFSDDNFRVWLTCESDDDTRDFYLDWVPVKVYYSFPDLIITDKREIWDGCNFTVSYKVKNQGNGTAGESNATLYVDDIPVENQTTPALGPGWSTGELTFDYVVSCPCDETRTIKVCADNDTVIAESDETNNCVMQDVVCPKPDLIITDKHENWIDTNTFTVSYKVKNQGPCPAGASIATLYVDGSDVEHQDTPALDPDASTGEMTFDYEVTCPCGETVNVTVCADNGGDIDESDETNNCAVNFVDRDLVITDIWTDNSKIYYEIENKGSAKAPRSYSKLYVDGTPKDIDSVNELAPGKSSIESFWSYSWTCTSPEDTMEVCADYDKQINESDEDNKYIETWTCPTPTPTPTPTCPDLVIMDIWHVGSTIYYEIENIGGAAAPVSYSRLHIDGRLKRSDSVKTLAPGESSIESFSYRWSCTSSVDTIKVCADHTKRIAECIEYNNCRTETWSCGPTPTPTPAPTPTPTPTITPTPTPPTTCPDLVIMDIWHVGSTIYYEIENIGGAAAPVSYSRLHIDGRLKRSDSVKTLAPGESSIESFSYRWSCTSSVDTIKVCADHTKRIAECDETNNCLTETWPC